MIAVVLYSSNLNRELAQLRCQSSPWDDQTRRAAHISALNVCFPYVIAGSNFTLWYGEAFLLSGLSNITTRTAGSFETTASRSEVRRSTNWAILDEILL